MAAFPQVEAKGLELNEFFQGFLGDFSSSQRVAAAYFMVRLLASDDPRWCLAVGAAIGLECSRSTQ